VVRPRCGVEADMHPVRWLAGQRPAPPDLRAPARYRLMASLDAMRDRTRIERKSRNLTTSPSSEALSGSRQLHHGELRTVSCSTGRGTRVRDAVSGPLASALPSAAEGKFLSLRFRCGDNTPNIQRRWADQQGAQTPWRVPCMLLRHHWVGITGTGLGGGW